ncbi:DUF45 domain-containing protein [Prolixibacteraceae bacterium]|nr:DUF45 domain-containing protein [Prolixibacteraceae bacterium]
MIETKTVDGKDIGLLKIRRGSTKRTIRCSFKADGSISIGTPPYVSWEDITKWIEQNRQCLIKNKQKVGNKTTSNLPDVWAFEDRNYRIEFQDIDRPKINENANGIVLTLPTTATKQKVETIKADFLNSVVKIEAKRSLPKRLSYWSEKLQLPYRKCFIKNNKTNWGSCSSLGNINLNQHLMRLPSHLRDMVIIHELIHTIIPNHGKDFQTALLKIIPNIKHMEQELKQYHPHRW